MSANSKIEWCDHTFNPWIGCTKVSPGCVNCYAEGESKRRGWAQWGKGKERHRTSENYWKQPLRWNSSGLVCVECGTPIANSGVAIDCECGQAGALGHMRRPRVFCASLADWLDDEGPVEWLADLLALIHATPNLDWLLLTKRPKNWEMRLRLAADSISENKLGRKEDWKWIRDWVCEAFAPSNVWLGVSVEDQQRADERIPLLIQIPAAVRFLSCEPLLGKIEFSNANNRSDVLAMLGKRALTGVDWVICGGESGPRRRPMDPAWARSLRDQCAGANVPFFMKQMDKKLPIPEDLMVREFPITDHRSPITSSATA